MVLPHQMPLYEAYDAVETDDFARAEAAIKRFFDALENDSIAQGCRRQHLDRQVFEADFLSILTREEIDAWSILSL